MDNAVSGTNIFPKQFHTRCPSVRASGNAMKRQGQIEKIRHKGYECISVFLRRPASTH
jgi:hypothetical protein